MMKSVALFWVLCSLNLIHAENQPDGKCGCTVINNWSSEHSQEHQLVYKPNWKQCTWKSLNEGKDSGKILGCTFLKKSKSSSLRVTYQGDIRQRSPSGMGCNRWYFTFNDTECSAPASIEGVVHVVQSNINHHRVATIVGFCDNLPQGTVSVDLHVGLCVSYKLGEAYTCWNSVCRVIIEEVEKSQ